MKAREEMTREVATVGAGTPASKTAALLPGEEIRAAPAVGDSGAPSIFDRHQRRGTPLSP
jgi:hypothetical protein